MFTKFVLPMIAVAGLSFAIVTVVKARRTPDPVPPIVEPPRRPFPAREMIAGAGLVEAKMENIPVGTPFPGVVHELFVVVGQPVKKGQPLFRLDDRALNAELNSRLAELEAARVQLHKLKSAPRPEDIPPARAAVEQAQAILRDAEVAMNREARLMDRKMGAPSDYDKARYTFYAAKGSLAKAEAELKRIMAGSWAEDIAVAEAAVQQAQAKLESTRVDLDRLTVRALADGQVLQVNVRPGQFAAMNWREPMVILGDVARLHVRVDIDEQDLARFKPNTPAYATLRGRPDSRFDLKFVRVEPYVIPKKSLTGDNTERVDVRVLQVIYALPDERSVPVYVGQQMDVYLEAVEKVSAKSGPAKTFQGSPGAPAA